MESDVDKAFDVIFKLPRIVCTFPFSRQYRVSKWRLCISVGVLVVAGYILFIGIGILFHSNRNRINAVCKLLYFGTLYGANWVNLITLMRKSQFGRIKSVLNQIESTIRDKGIVWRHDLKWYKIDLNSYITLAMLLSLFLTNKSIRQFIETFKVFIFFFTSFQLSNAIISQVDGMYSLIRSLMSQIKKIDSSHTQVKLNEALISVTETVNEWYGPQLAFITFGYCISIFDFLTGIFRGNDVTLFPYLVGIGLLQILQILMAVIPITSQTKKVDEFFQKRLLLFPNDEILAFHVLSGRSLKLCVCGFFNFDSTLLSSLIKFGTTYIVISLQYGEDGF